MSIPGRRIHGGLIIYLMGKIIISDLGIMLCIAVILLSIDSLTR